MYFFCLYLNFDFKGVEPFFNYKKKKRELMDNECAKIL